MMPKPESRENRKSKLFIKDTIDKMVGYGEMVETQGNIPGFENLNWLQRIKESAQAIIEEIDEMERRNK